MSKLNLTLQIVNSSCFVLATIVGGIAFWSMPQKQISEDEKRELAAMPIATQQSVFSGVFGKKFEEYYNDHFPYRDDWMNFANELNQFKGKQNQEFRVLEIPKAPQPAPTAQTQQPTSQSASEPVASDKPNSTEDEVANMQEEFSKVRGVVVVNGRVVQNFAGSKATITPFVQLVDRFRKALPASVKMYTMLIPSGSDYYLPYQVNHGEMKEKQSIDLFNQMISPDIIRVHAYDEILPHKKEYIAFRTDHHWTALGAYYAYRAFAKAAGFTPLELNQMETVKAEKPFLGSLYLYTKDPELKKNPDTLEYYKVPTTYTVTMKKSATGAEVPAVLYYANTNNYGAFLGGDWAYIHVKTNVNNGRKILIIKDSFGNAFAPYLAAHYQDVYVIDYRYYKASVIKLIQEQGIQEFVYAHNTFAANSGAVVKFGQIMLGK